MIITLINLLNILSMNRLCSYLMITATMVLSSSLFPLLAEPAILESPSGAVSPQAQIKVSGTVKDDSGPLAGVAVIEKGTRNGVVTANDGSFTITVASESSVLEFSSLGYATQEIIVGSQRLFNIILESSNTMLDETVVVGYGTMRKRDVTGAISSADLESFKKSQNVNIMQSLKGSVPGLTVSQTNQAGQDVSMRIRGVNTLSGSTSPLIVVDGIVFTGSLNYINPADVKSVDILKDASSKAIYGAQAANGVILITTNSGSINEKYTVRYSGSVSFSEPTANYRLFNAEEIEEHIKGVYYTKAYLAPDYTTPNPDFSFFNDTELAIGTLEGMKNGVNFDWWKEVSRAPVATNHNISVSGGSSVATSYLSFGYTDSKGILKNDDYRRYTARVNLTYNIQPWLTIGVIGNGTFADYSGNSPTSFLSMLPFNRCYDDDGNIIMNPKTATPNIGAGNPLLIMSADNKDLRNEIGGIAYAEIRFPWVDGLKYRANFNKTFTWSNGYNSNQYGANETGSASKVHAELYDQTFDNILSYENTFNRHSVNATLVYGARKAGYDNMNASGTDYSSMALSYNSLQQGVIQKISSTAWAESQLYQMGRINYNYDNRYFLTATIRRDGYSGFAENNKIGYFPSVAIGWTLTNESFWKIKPISYLKLRLSYGENGNLTSRYSSLAEVSATAAYKYVYTDGGQTSVGQAITTLSNPDLKWEKTAGYNFGLDYGLFDNRVSGSVEYYMTTTHDLLWDMVIPSVTGFSKIRSNIGEVKNRGLEFNIKAIPVKTSDFTWDLNLTFAANRNKVTHLLGDVDGDGVEDDLVASNLFIGKSIGTIYDYEVDGIYQIGDEIPTGFYPGTYRIVDHDGVDGITADDRTFLGRTEPAYTIGLQNNFTYKRLTLRSFLHSIQGGKDYYMKGQVGNWSNSTGNSVNNTRFNYIDMWSPVNPDAKDAQSYLAAKVTGKRYQQRNFVRLADVSLSYTFSPKVVRRIGLGGLEVYISGKNLFTITNWDGWDPETGQDINTSDYHPVMKSYNLGVEVSF